MTIKTNAYSAALCHKLPSLGQFLFPILLAAAVLFCISPASAQLSGKGEIKGIVTDPSGAVVSGAVVTATSTTRNIKVTRTTTSSGDYDLSPLDPGSYTVVVTAQGFQTTRRNTSTSTRSKLRT